MSWPLHGACGQSPPMPLTSLHTRLTSLDCHTCMVVPSWWPLDAGARARLLLHQPRRAVVAHRPPAGSAAAARPYRQGPEPGSPGPRRWHLHLHLPEVREGRVSPRHAHEPAPAHPHRPGNGAGHAGGGVGGRAKRVGCRRRSGTGTSIAPLDAGSPASAALPYCGTGALGR